MTDEQINAAIAEACGWRWDHGYRWKDSSGLSAFAWDIPDYYTASKRVQRSFQRFLLSNYTECRREEAE